MSITYTAMEPNPVHFGAEQLVLYLMSPSSAALQKVLGHMGAVAIRLTLLV